MSRRNKKRLEWHSGNNKVTATEPLDDSSAGDVSKRDQPPWIQEEESTDAEPIGGNESPSWRRLVAQHPVLTLVSGFGVGVGLGVLGVAALGAARRDRSLHFPGRLHHLSGSLSGIPRMIAEQLPESRLWS